jgi:ectoine hydroxylase-related dioxygenase (phytanoyl-CoA dioxygenase family)
VFENPLEALLKHQPIKALQDRNTYHTLFDHEVKVEAGDLVIFPGWLRHKTQVNSSNSDRIMIGANINYRA